MNSASSEAIDSGSQAEGWLSVRSWYQTSRPSTQGTCAPVRFTVTTVCTPGHSASAVSVLSLSGTVRPPRTPWSAVMTV